jgi:hypothetical protein
MPQHGVARGAGPLGVAVRPPRLRPAGDCDQQRGLRRVERPRRSAEPGERAGLHPLQIAAHRGEGQPDAEDLVLREPRVELEGAQALHGLAAQGARPRLQQPRRLHRQGRAAGDHPAARPRPLPGGTGKGERVHAGVQAEAAVLGGDEHLDEVRRQVGGGCREAPDAAGGGQDGKGAALAVQDLGAGGAEA